MSVRMQRWEENYSIYFHQIRNKYEYINYENIDEWEGYLENCENEPPFSPKTPRKSGFDLY